eukprot:2438629-Pyramimonas_sp.AAC.1
MQRQPPALQSKPERRDPPLHRDPTPCHERLVIREGDVREAMAPEVVPHVGAAAAPLLHLANFVQSPVECHMQENK